MGRVQGRRRGRQREWRLLLAALMCFVAAPATAGERWAELAATVFQNYGREQGLPHPVPTALAQDGDGFLWVGTQGGLGRWDGYRFRGYKLDPKDPFSLPDSWIQVLHADPQGRLWVGTGANGLARYDRDADHFVAIAAIHSPTGRTHIGAIADDGAGGLWVGTDAGLDHLDPATGAITVLHHDVQDPASLPDDQVGAVLQDREGRLWIG